MINLNKNVDECFNILCFKFITEQNVNSLKMQQFSIYFKKFLFLKISAILYIKINDSSIVNTAVLND